LLLSLLFLLCLFAPVVVVVPVVSLHRHRGSPRPAWLSWATGSADFPQLSELLGMLLLLLLLLFLLLLLLLLLFHLLGCATAKCHVPQVCIAQ